MIRGDETCKVFFLFVHNIVKSRSYSYVFRISPNKTHKPSIAPVLWKTFGGSFLFASAIDLLQNLLAFTSPQLLGYVITFIESSKDENAPEIWKGYMFAILLFVGATAQTFLLTQFFRHMLMVGFRIRTALVGAIYRKALRVSNATRKESTIGEITNLMSIDADRFAGICV